MAKKEKNKAKESDIPNISEKEKIGKKTKKVLNDLKEKEPDKHYVISVPDDAIIDIKVSGYFRKRFEEVFYYLLSPLETDEIVKVMLNIKNNFKGVPENEITVTYRGIESMMILMNEINYQAAKQEKTAATDQYLNESLSSFLTGFNGEQSLGEVAKEAKNWKELKDMTIEDAVEFSKKIIEKDSNEDSSQ